MGQLKNIYKKKILEYNIRPKNYGILQDPTYIVKEENEQCGDSFILFVKMGEDVINEITFEAEGCAILKASASIMTEMVKNKSHDFARKALEEYFDTIKKGKGTGPFEIFASFKAFPSRIACSRLPWNCLKKVIEIEEMEL